MEFIRTLHQRPKKINKGQIKFNPDKWKCRDNFYKKQGMSREPAIGGANVRQRKLAADGGAEIVISFPIGVVAIGYPRAEPSE